MLNIETEKLLRAALSVLNAVPNRRLNLPDFANSYAVASAIESALDEASKAAPEYTRDHMENACCLWEAMLDAKASNKNAAFMEAFSRHGYGQMRHFAIDLAVQAEEAWNKLSDDERDDIGAFDWDFCPGFIVAIDWTQWPPVAPAAQ